MTEPEVIELVVPPREAKISVGFTVKRILPFRARRTVGPFCFLDHMGPLTIGDDTSADVLAHPHIGLSTLTYLFSGSINHRDSTGVVQNIRPGDVNWMTAGRGIVHSERVDRTQLGEFPILHGLQAWVALPKDLEECEPIFRHHPEAEIPMREQDGTRFSLIAGTVLGLTSPVEVSSPLFYGKVEMAAGGKFAAHFPGQESAFYLLNGSITIAGRRFSEPTLIVFKNDVEVIIEASVESLGVLLGGAPLSEKRLMYWNFVATKQELIDRAKESWRAQTFPHVPGENKWIPLPESGGA